jgi:hypothetical protein
VTQLSREKHLLHVKEPHGLKSWRVVPSNNWQYLYIVAAHCEGLGDCFGADVRIPTARKQVREDFQDNKGAHAYGFVKEKLGRAGGRLQQGLA